MGREREQKAQSFKLSLRDHKHIWSSCISSIFQPQGFANSGKGERGGGKFPTVGRGDRKLHWGEFFMGWWEPEEEWFSWFKPFSKLNSAFYEYWTSIKIKISMTCVFKEYKIKTKMVKKHWRHLKMFLLGCNLKIVIKWGDWLLVGGRESNGMELQAPPSWMPDDDNPLIFYVILYSLYFINFSCIYLSTFCTSLISQHSTTIAP